MKKASFFTSRLFLAMLGSLVLLSGCGGGEGAGESGVPASTASLLAGRWVGTAESQVFPGGTVQIVLDVQQSGTSVSGLFTCASRTLLCIHPSGTVTGTVTGPILTATATYPDGHACQFTAMFDSTTMRGSYSCRDPLGDDAGSFSLTKS